MGMLANDFVKIICKVCEGEKTCRYLLMGTKGWECGKTNLEMKEVVDKKVASMSAQGDNCPGV